MKRKIGIFKFIILPALLVIVFFGAIFRRNLTIVYMVNTYIPAKQLPHRWVIPALEYVTGCEFPLKVSNASGIFQGGRDPSMFAAFKADPNEIEQLITRNFHKAIVKVIDTEFLEFSRESGYTFFPAIDSWQKELRVQLYNRNTIGKGKLIEYNERRGLTVFIDRENDIIYIYAWYC